MANVEGVFNRTFCAIRNNPQLLLPFVLTWLPSALISLSATLIWKNIVDKYTLSIITSRMESDPIGLASNMFSDNVFLVIFLFLAYTLSIIISSYVNAIYPRISLQIYRKMKLSMTDAVRNANEVYMKVLWTSVLFDSISILVFGGAIVIIAAIYGVFSGIGVPWFINLAVSGAYLLALLVFLVFVVPANMFLAPIVVIEKMSGFTAIRKSFYVLKGHLKDVWIYIIMLTIANGIYLSFANTIESLISGVIGPYGKILTSVFVLFPAAFILLAYGIIYLELTRKGQERLEDGFVNC